MQPSESGRRLIDGRQNSSLSWWHVGPDSLVSTYWNMATLQCR